MQAITKELSPKIFKWIDLTHELSEQIPTWSGECGFRHIDLVTYEECSTECKFLVQSVEMVAGIGTHMDAPAHCFPGAKTIAEIPLQELISPCVVINVSHQADETYCIDMQAVEEFERQYGKISKQTCVIFYTGWDRFWNEPEKYHNHYQFPSIAASVADYLVSKDIVGIGIDTLSPDRPDSGFPVHRILLGSNKYIIENVANAHLMPPIGGYVFAMPIKSAKGTEAPMRLLGAFIDHKRSH